MASFAYLHWSIILLIVAATLSFDICSATTADCPDEYANSYCLNGGTCFTVTINNNTIFGCYCSDGYVGKRCERKSVPNVSNP
ncbi:Protein spitz-like protein [Dinothrombium tinctorium]|uniref:Protein spitz-like protein n=1 Tax=Dinothrombium tinctorium TaxID=1965070 RepID=A0A443QHG8_9ACAR|nr:Protein spitz-like protein [Dinothrombium tinctorium]RWS02461.1 Protein spitz-like protein [Dinothrombium tinctorium]